MLSVQMPSVCRKGLGVVAIEVQTPTFMPGHGAAYRQLRHRGQVAQLDQIAGHAEIAVVVGDLALEQFDTSQGTLQTLVGAHDAHVVPHEVTQLVPVVGHHDALIRISDTAFIPGGQRRRYRDTVGQFLLQPLDCRLRKHAALQQGIAGQSIGAVDAGAGAFTHRIQARQVGAGIQVGDHAAAGVVSRRHHRDGFTGDVYAEFLAAPGDIREVLQDFLGRLVGDVQVHAVVAAALHLEVDGPGNDVAWGEFTTRVMLHP